MDLLIDILIDLYHNICIYIYIIRRFHVISTIWIWFHTGSGGEASLQGRHCNIDRPPIPLRCAVAGFFRRWPGIWCWTSSAQFARHQLTSWLDAQKISCLRNDLCNKYADMGIVWKILHIYIYIYIYAALYVEWIILIWMTILLQEQVERDGAQRVGPPSDKHCTDDMHRSSLVWCSARFWKKILQAMGIVWNCNLHALWCHKITGASTVIDQGLVTVPFWEYWTSPYSSHYRPYT